MGSTFLSLHYHIVFSTNIEAVRQYIATQEEHHRGNDFVAELRTLLDKNGVKYEKKYLL